MKKFINANIFATAAILLVLLPLFSANCVFGDNNGAWNIKGIVVFSQVGGGAVSINGVLSGFNTSWNGTKHGMHIHDSGDLSDSCSKTGLHFNPDNTTHGDLNDTVRHVGDLGNVVVNSTGFVNINLVDSLLSLATGSSHSIIGRSLVVHSLKDDLGKNPTNNNSLINGNSGPKIACCKITLASPLPTSTNVPFNSADGFHPMILTTFIYSILAAISRLSRH